MRKDDTMIDVRNMVRGDGQATAGHAIYDMCKQVSMQCITRDLCGKDCVFLKKYGKPKDIAVRRLIHTTVSLKDGTPFSFPGAACRGQGLIK